MKKLIILSITLLVLNQQSTAQGYWHTINTPNYFLPHYGIDVSFINDSTGWMADNYNSIFKTTDAGEHWDSISFITAGQLRSMEFVNDTLGFCGSLSSATVSGGNLYKTTDGGYTWAPVSNLPMSMYEGVCGIEKYGSRIVAVGSVNTPAWLYKSDDYGTTWTKTDMSAYASALIDCKMINFDTILVSGAANNANLNKAVILRSTDGGNTWQQVYISQFPNTFGWKMFINNNGKGLCSVQDPFVGTNSITAGHTTDFGQTWQTMVVSTPPSSWYWAAGVCFLNDSIGWLSCEYNGLTYETRNGGLTWDSIPLVDGINRFAVLGPATVIAPGNMFIFKYDSTTVGINPVAPHSSTPINSIRLLPNPVKNNVVIEATAWRNILGSIKIIDSQGRVVKDFGKQFFVKGKNTSQQKINLPQGNYTVIWISNDGYASAKLSVLK